MTRGFDWNEFKDTGCSFYPRCLQCPLPQCRYDLEEENNLEYRNQFIILQYLNGSPITELAKEYNLAHRTVRKIVKPRSVSRIGRDSTNPRDQREVGQDSGITLLLNLNQNSAIGP